MKQKLIIKTHSFVDIITNSSTELFVCDGSKTLNEVREIIQKQWELFLGLQENIDDKPYQLEDMENPNNVYELLDVFQAKDKKCKENWGWGDYNDGMYKPGDIIISGTGDNSIPYEFFDIIENTFNAERYHLG